MSGGISFTLLRIDLLDESADNTFIHQGVCKMMLLIFVFMTLALSFGWFGYRALSIGFVFLCLVLVTKEFLWEIHSAEYGYSMPWLQF